MPIVSWKETERTTLSVGDFLCPTCGPAPYTRQRVRRYVRLTSVPLIPLSPEHEILRCDRCRTEYDPGLLDGPMDADMPSLRELAVRLMAAMVVADGIVAEEEITALVAASALLPDGALTREEVLVAVRAAEDDPLIVVSGSADALEQADRELLFLVAMSIAMADGELADEELLLLTSIGDALGLDVAESLVELAGTV